MTETPQGFRPLVPAEEQQPELTVRAILLGAILGIVFGAASTYLALRVGLTVSASVPIAVIAIAAIRRRQQQRAILEHNIVQTAGSAGESVAAAVVFTVPALIFLGYPLQVGLTTLIALTGGMLGVLMMVPLRRYLIVKEHGVLRYPEGKACAEILAAGEQGGTSARKVFVGIAVGALIKALQAVLAGVKGTVEYTFAFFKGSTFSCDVAPELMGVGYIIGYRTSVMMVAGSILASFILVPIIVMFGSGASTPLAPATETISAIFASGGAGGIWHNYVRHIGAGAVATGGIFGLVRALPAIWSSLASSFRSLTGGGASGATAERTDRDTPVAVLLVGAVAIVAFLWAVPLFQINLLGAVLILVLGFLFAVVSSRITGEVGSSSCPLSGMTIAVLMGTCGAFLLVGWEGARYGRLALMIGAVVCIAISNAGTCSQDLKTGFLVGATPVKQQLALLVGVVASVLAIGWTAFLLNLSQTQELPVKTPFPVPAAMVQKADPVDGVTESGKFRFVRLSRQAERPGEAQADQVIPAGALILRKVRDEKTGAEKTSEVAAPDGNYLVDEVTGQARYLREDGIGSGRLQAPQAKLMSVVIDGLLTHRLPWDLILLGVAIALFIELMGFRSLTFAVGVYLPLSSTMPVFLGGLVRKIADLAYRRTPDAEEESEGTLYCSGIIAGASILGILAAMISFLPGYNATDGIHPQLAVLAGWLEQLLPGVSWAGDAFGLGVLALLGFFMFRGAAARRQA